MSGRAVFTRLPAITPQFIDRMALDGWLYVKARRTPRLGLVAYFRAKQGLA
ncbi:MAG TPA: hypothetical protein VEA38_11325 [Terriglobales bacterium]|nr:hypothetical protein [Terriglobales bacterium]